MVSVLRSLAVDVWNSVTRIADGIEPDEGDRACLRRAAATMRGERETLDWVSRDGEGSVPTGVYLPVDEYWTDVVWEAVIQLRLKETFGPYSNNALPILADALDRVATGDRATAKEIDALTERMALLCEMYA